MNKSDLINALADKTQLSRKNAEKNLNAFVDTIVSKLAEGEKVQLIGFGTFEVKTRSARTARNHIHQIFFRHAMNCGRLFQKSL
ncbi:MAG: HU family DNA-binding protein [Clostridia bacterium]|nr:HU family DNA-binding protein [Clostridia bacterium]